MKKRVKNQKSKSENYEYYLPLGMTIGISTGMVIGSSTNNMPLCISIGLTVGVCIGLILANIKRSGE